MASIYKQLIAPKQGEIPTDRIKELNEFLQKASSIPYCKPDGNPKKEWNLSIGKTWDEAEVAAIRASETAASDKTVKSEWGAANDPNLVKGIGGILFTSRSAAWAAIWHSTTKAAKDAGRLEALNKTQPRFLEGERRESDIELMARLILVKDLHFEGKDKFLKHAAERMEVWEKGYSSVGDVNGVLYVYAKGNSKYDTILRN
jgi:hypothetical protein